jgi:hypothetical protein
MPASTMEHVVDFAKTMKSFKPTITNPMNLSYSPLHQE